MKGLPLAAQVLALLGVCYASPIAQEAATSIVTAAPTEYSIKCNQQIQENVASNGVTTVSWKAAGPLETTIPQATLLYDKYNGRVWDCLLTNDFAYAPYCAQRMMEAWAYSQWPKASAQTTCGTAQKTPVTTTISMATGVGPNATVLTDSGRTVTPAGLITVVAEPTATP